MKNLKELVISLLVSVGVGTLSGFLTRGSMAVYRTLELPPLSPPGWVFPVVWTMLFTLMGIASWLVWQCGPEARKRPLALYAIQLAVNFVWPLLFFNFELFWAAFFWLLLLLVLVISTMVSFYRANRTAAFLLLPYLLWLLYAGYLNLGVALLN